MAETEASDEFLENVTYVAPLVAEKIRTISNAKGWHPSELAKGNKKVNNQTLWQMLKQMDVSLPHPDNGGASEPSTSVPQELDALAVSAPSNPDVEQVAEVGVNFWRWPHGQERPIICKHGNAEL